MFLGLLEYSREGIGEREWEGGGVVGERVVPASVIHEQRHLHAGSFVKPHARTIRVFVANCLTTIRSGFRLNDIYYYPFY